MEEETGKKSYLFTAIAVAIVIVIIVPLLVLVTRPRPIEKEPALEYNHFPFYEEQGLWKTTLQRDAQEFELTLRFNPEQVENVTYLGQLSPEFVKQQPIYITFDPDAEEQQMKYLALSAAEVGLSLVRGFGLNIEAACTKEMTEPCQNRTIIQCGDNASVIYLKVSNQTGTYLKNRCITIQGKDFEMLKAVDRMLYQWYGIIKAEDLQLKAQLENQLANYKKEATTLLANE